MRVDLVDVLSKLAAWFGLYLLNLLETAGLDEGSLGLKVRWEYLSELGADVGEDVVWSKLEEWFKGWQVGAHLDDVFKRFLGLIFQIFGTLWEHVDGEES